MWSSDFNDEKKLENIQQIIQLSLFPLHILRHQPQAPSINQIIFGHNIIFVLPHKNKVNRTEFSRQ
jgi:hypothetical protein